MRSTKLLDVYLWCFAAVALHVLVPDVHLCGEGRYFFVNVALPCFCRKSFKKLI